MKIFVCCKQVPDVAMTIQVRDGGIVRDGMNYVLNAYDASCVEEALVLKEKHGAEVSLVLIGGESGKEALRKGLAMGADNAYHIDDEVVSGLNSQTAAQVLKSFFEKNPADVILTGKQAQDSDMGLGGGVLASFLDLPYVTNAVGLDIEEGQVLVSRQGDEGVEKVLMPMPSVITCSNDMNEPRIPSLKGIMSSKKKPMETLSLADLDLDPSVIESQKSRAAVTGYQLPPQREPGQKIEGDTETLVSTLMEKLTRDAKVL